MTLHTRFTLVFALVLALTALANPAAAQTFSVLHYFSAGGDGAGPRAPVTVGPSGAVYGTVSVGGSYGAGLVFKLSQVNSAWIFSPLYQFTGGSDGANPVGGVVFGPDNKLYGTAQLGGINRNGLVFSLSPPATFCHSTICYWHETILHSFTGSPDGFNPWTENLVFDPAGNIYGTTGNGGAYGAGTVFELTRSGGGYTETVLHSFGGIDGAYPLAGVVLDDAGNLYGTTENGGPILRLCSFGCGTAYQVTPSGGSWLESTVHIFDFLHGYYPNSAMIRDAAGNLYGTAIASANYNDGVAFKLAPSEGGFDYTLLHQFTSDCEPYGALAMDAAGNFFGTCVYGGSNGAGWVYELTNCTDTCDIIDLHDFNQRDGSMPTAGPTLDANGNLYGTTEFGGTGDCNLGCGVVWEITGAGAPLKR